MTQWLLIYADQSEQRVDAPTQYQAYQQRDREKKVVRCVELPWGTVEPSHP
jgi:hypothetical protein